MVVFDGMFLGYRIFWSTPLNGHEYPSVSVDAINLLRGHVFKHRSNYYLCRRHLLVWIAQKKTLAAIYLVQMTSVHAKNWRYFFCGVGYFLIFLAALCYWWYDYYYSCY